MAWCFSGLRGISALLGRDKHGETVHKTTTRDVLELIKRVVLEEAGKLGVRVERIILFGSRARGDYREDSDYDILVVVSERLDWRVKRRLSLMIRRRLVRELGMPVDLVIVSLRYWEEYKDVPGTVLYPAEREGIVIA